MIGSDLIIETERLILRPLRVEDVDDLLEYQSHPEIVRYIPWPERTREEVVTALNKTIEQGKSELKSEGDFIVLAWELKDCEANRKLSGFRPGKVIGQSNSALESIRDQVADIGWVTHQEFQRVGYAYEATYAFMQFIFTHFEIHRIIANIDTRNPESAKLAEKLGMRREGEFRDSEFFKGDWCSMWLYAILKNEFLYA